MSSLQITYFACSWGRSTCSIGGNATTGTNVLESGDFLYFWWGSSRVRRTRFRGRIKRCVATTSHRVSPHLMEDETDKAHSGKLEPTDRRDKPPPWRMKWIWTWATGKYLPPENKYSLTSLKWRNKTLNSYDLNKETNRQNAYHFN